MNASRITYYEPADVCTPDDAPPNILTAEVQDGGCGPYVVIETTRWAFEDRSEAIEAINTIFDALIGKGAK